VHAARGDDARYDRRPVTSSRPARPPLDAALATPDDKHRYVRRLFHTIADRYDLITVLLSFGRDQAWKRRLCGMAGATPSTAALDLACGTGDLAYALSRRGARVIGLDLVPRMIALARVKGGEGKGGQSPPSP
jgi:ubiquinone/menaquinone biosynthesis C-methylase UbiE